MMTIAFDDVPNPFKRLATIFAEDGRDSVGGTRVALPRGGEVSEETSRVKGVFEAHITIAARDRSGGSDVGMFERWCEASGTKCVLIALPRGVCTFQPMTATYHRGGFADVREQVFGLAREIDAAGFAVSRVKIEATGANSGLPQTSREARRAPNNYFEFHMKVVLRNAAERAALETVARAYGAHLSRNARFAGADGSEERFVTLRAYGVGQQEAAFMFRAFDDAVRKLGLPVSHRLTEYAVYDTNVALDDGWATRPAQSISA